MVNRDNTLTVEWLLKAVADGRVRTDMPIGVVSHSRASDVLGVDAFEIHTYADGTKVFVMHCESVQRPVASEAATETTEVGL